MALIRLDVGSLSFNTGTADGNGNRWYYQKLEGWDMPAIRQTWVDRLGAHGQVLAESNMGARTIVVAGVVIGVSPSGIWTAWTAMRTALQNAVTVPVNVVLHAPTGTQTLASCYTSDRLRMELTSGVAFRYQFAVTAGTPTIV
jgi:hypothetical protein